MSPTSSKSGAHTSQWSRHPPQVASHALLAQPRRHPRHYDNPRAHRRPSPASVICLPITTHVRAVHMQAPSTSCRHRSCPPCLICSSCSSCSPVVRPACRTRPGNVMVANDAPAL
ncbi:hypothetical protein T440DRAFT_277041 [Plenodomus tracheiphilus IPT5]|uniref:Uncharacterized protein n=1 Tax=Plenodomus tracheiphilus IPT5 TaxID=1408161 RepID=A0A6A7ASS4_9PLEO|nr:hypothetical protein T440DRAFT_277041 [Plenodomus tracheiphilus IPT5]